MSSEFRDADDFVGEVLDRGGLIGDYVLAAEVVYDDHVELQIGLSRGMSPWKAVGMLDSTSDIISAVGPHDPAFERYRIPEDDEEDGELE